MELKLEIPLTTLEQMGEVSKNLVISRISDDDVEVMFKFNGYSAKINKNVIMRNMELLLR